MLNTGKLAGKTILITGASRGIGKEIALKCAKVMHFFTTTSITED